MITHFTECIKNVKSSRQEAIQINIFTAILCGLKGLMENKSTIGQDDVRISLTNLIVVNGLTHSNPILRCATAEALGRLAQVVGETRVTVELTQDSFNNLKSARDVVTRTGHSLALGCLLRYVGSMGSAQLLSTSVSILLALAQDASSSGNVVQVWALYALSLIAESGGPMFRSFVEPTLNLSIKLLLTVPHSFVDVHQCVGRLLSALITTMGPELQETPTLCSSFLSATAILQSHPDPLVQSEAIGCIQQLHMFTAQSINLATLVPGLCVILNSNYLSLRKAAVSCLRQLTTREAKEVCEYAAVVTNQDENYDIAELGLPAVLFQMLDKETDVEMIKNIHDTIISMLQMLAAENLTQWLNLCKNVLTVATAEDLGVKDNIMGSGDLGCDEEDDDDNMEFHAEDNQATHPQLQPRWPTRVFAAECVRKIIATCEQANPVHFDMMAAKEKQATRLKNSDFLVLHLSDLIRMAFMAATSDSDQLKLEGMKTLQEIIIKFGHVPEPEFPGHLLLEQYQAQVGAALRPAFASDVPSNITAAACEVCSAWIASGVARDLNDLRRVHQLLVSSLDKLNTKSNTSKLYNESMTTLEKLSILKAWAQVYIVAMITNGTAPANTILEKLSSSKKATRSVGLKLAEDDDEFGDFESRGESLLALVQPELQNLSEYWLAALKDYALLSLPPEYQHQLPHDGGAFYTNDTINSARPHYLSSWPPILHAAALWLNNGGFDTTGGDVYKDEPENLTPFDIADNNGNAHKNGHGSLSADRFHMIFGICMEALCSTRSYEKAECVTACLQSIHTILSSKWARKTLFVNKNLSIELCCILHRMVLTRDSLEVHLLCIEILRQVIQSADEQLEAEKLKKMSANNQQTEDNDNAKLEKNNETKCELAYLGEGGESGEIESGKSLIYSVLEVELCLLVRQIPAMNPSTNTCITTEALQHQLNINGNKTKLGIDNGMLVATALYSMEPLTKLCSPKGALKILPTILYLTTGVIKEMATKSCHDPSILANSATIQAALHLLKVLVTDKYATDERTSEDWMQLMQTALATIIDLTKTGSDETKMDEVTMMMAIAVFILHSKIDVVGLPDLQYPCINHFRQCMQSEYPSIRLRCIQTMRQIFTNANIKSE